MNFDKLLENYIELLVRRGLNVQKGQEVLISFDVVNREIALQAAESCYRAGAKVVSFEPLDLRLSRLSVLHADQEALAALPADLTLRYDKLVDARGARLYIDGLEDPTLLESLDPARVNALQSARYQALRRFYKEGINKDCVQWCVAAAATPGWAARILPSLPQVQAVQHLWELIFKASRADQPDPLRAWDEHDARLHSRGGKLNELKISELHFTGGGTELRVGLSKKAIFRGGSDISASGNRFNPNIPSEEVFTTPDWRRTEGHVRMTRPFMVNGVLVDGLELTFEQGRIVRYSANTGLASFEQYINRDEGAKQLGEVALVGVDSPIYQSGVVFRQTLFDENASCHIAIGSAYTNCLENGTALSKQELEALGCNESIVHSDMMISSTEVSVSARTYSGESVRIIERGEWCPGF